MENHGGNCSGVVFIVMVMAVMQLVLCILSLGLFLVGVAMPDGTIFIDSLLMISILNGVLKCNVMSVFSE